MTFVHLPQEEHLASYKIGAGADGCTGAAARCGTGTVFGPAASIAVPVQRAIFSSMICPGVLYLSLETWIILSLKDCSGLGKGGKVLAENGLPAMPSIISFR